MTVPTTLQSEPVTWGLVALMVAVCILVLAVYRHLLTAIKEAKEEAMRDAVEEAGDASRAAEARATAAAMVEINRAREECKTESERARSRNSELARSLDAFKLHVAQTHPTHDHVAAALNSVREDIKAMDGRITGQMADFRRDVREMLATLSGRHPPP